MPTDADATPPADSKPASAIPRTGLVQGLRDVLTGGGGRIDMLGSLRDTYAQHGPVVMRLTWPMRMVNLYGPDANRLVLLDRERIFSAKRPWDAIMGRIFPNGLLLRDGEDHKLHRKIMHSAFTRPTLRRYLERMNEMIELGIARLGDGPKPVLAFDTYKELTLDMAAVTFLGMDLGAGTGEVKRAFEDMVAASMSRLRLPLPGFEFQRGLEGRQLMVELLGDRIAKKRAADGDDMFTRLCHAETETGEALEDREIVDHLIFLMMAAHDTTTSTLTSMTYELAKHPEWQERLRQESRALGKPYLDFADQQRLPALDRVLRETLRLYPPLPVIPRVATRDFDFQGYRIPAGTMVVIAPIHTHHMEEWWDDPYRFDPERFSPERAEDQRHSHSWIPFGGGPHFCLGRRFAILQVSALMHQLVQRRRWSVPEGYRMPVQQAPISKPRDGLPVRFERLD